MSKKFTLIFIETKDFKFHLYDSIDKGHCIDVRYMDFDAELPIDEKQAKEIMKQIGKGDKNGGKRK